MRFDELPTVCHGCSKLGSDARDEYSPPYFYCEASQLFPTRTNRCRRRERMDAQRNPTPPTEDKP